MVMFGFLDPQGQVHNIHTAPNRLDFNSGYILGNLVNWEGDDASVLFYSLIFS